MASRAPKDLATLLAGPGSNWNGRPPLERSEFDLIYPKDQYTDPDWHLPCFRKRVSERLRSWFALTYPGLDPDNVLYALDMELLHIHHKGRELLWSKKGKLCKCKANDKLRRMELRLYTHHPLGQKRIRQDDWVLIDGGTKSEDPEHRPHITTEEIIVFFVERFGPWRFVNGTVPCPTGTSLIELDEFKASTHWFRFNFEMRAIKAVIGDSREFNRIILRDHGKVVLKEVWEERATESITRGQAHLKLQLQNEKDGKDPMAAMSKEEIKRRTAELIAEHSVGGHGPVKLDMIWDKEGPDGASIAVGVSDQATQDAAKGKQDANEVEAGGKAPTTDALKGKQGPGAWRAGLAVDDIMVVAKQLREHRQKVGYSATEWALQGGMTFGDWVAEVTAGQTRLLAGEQRKRSRDEVDDDDEAVE